MTEKASERKTLLVSQGRSKRFARVEQICRAKRANFFRPLPLRNLALPLQKSYRIQHPKKDGAPSLNHLGGGGGGDSDMSLPSPTLRPVSVTLDVYPLVIVNLLFQTLT